MYDENAQDDFDFDGPADAGAGCFDINDMDANDPYGRRPCHCPQYHPDNPHDGCRKCNPPQGDNCPYGFGIESFEDPALEEANLFSQQVWLGGPYHNYTWQQSQHARRAIRDERWKRNSKQSKRRARHAEIVWDKLCDQCETHAEARRKYAAWAKRAVKIRYRDEKPGE